MTGPWWKHVVFAIIPAAFVAAVILVAGEVTLRRRYGHDVTRITGVAEWKVAEAEGLTYAWDLYSPLLGWTNAPGYHSDGRLPFRLTINAQGLRGDREYSPRPPPGVRRVAVFGDSFAFGLEVDDDETVPAILERQLRATEVLNFGVNGYGLGQMILRLEDDGFAFAPDHVVMVILVPTDLARDTTSEFTHPKPVFSADATGLVVGNVPVPEASRQPWIVRHSFTAAWLWGRPREVRRPEQFRELLKVTHALFVRLKERAAAQRVPATVVLILGWPQIQSMSSEFGFRQSVASVAPTAEALDLDVLDLTSYLEEQYRVHGRSLGKPRGHWSAPANCLIADMIARHLASRDDAWRRVENGAPCEEW